MYCKVNKFKLKDFEDVYKLNLSSYEFPMPRLTLLLFSILSDILVVCDDEERIIAYLILGYIQRDILFILNIAVSSEGRGKGIGSLLLKGALKGYEFKECKVVARVSNTEAQRFYEKNGFRKVEVIKRWSVGGEDVFLYTLNYNNLNKF